MKFTMQKVIIVGLLSVLMACSTSPTETLNESTITALDVDSQPESNIRDYSRFSSMGHNKSLNDYAQQLVMELNTRQAIHKPIAVASFVEFDHALNSTNSIGNQLAESVLIELGQMGYPTADINANRSVNSNSKGNFVFSREQKELSNEYCCVLSGNLIYEQGGIRVNAKLIELDSSSILGASSVTIPYFVVEHLGFAQSH